MLRKGQYICSQDYNTVLPNHAWQKLYKHYDKNIKAPPPK